MIKFSAPFSASMLAALLLLMSCNSRPEGVSAADERNNIAQAMANAGCIFEDQNLCSELIQKRGIVGQYFNPLPTGKIKEGEKKHGQSVLTFRIVEAAASIRQCNKTDAKTVPLIQKLKIGGDEFSFLATSPVSETSSCFISRLEG